MLLTPEQQATERITQVKPYMIDAANVLPQAGPRSREQRQDSGSAPADKQGQKGSGRGGKGKVGEKLLRAAYFS